MGSRRRHVHGEDAAVLERDELSEPPIVHGRDDLDRGVDSEPVVLRGDVAVEQLWRFECRAAREDAAVLERHHAGDVHLDFRAGPPRSACGIQELDRRGVAGLTEGPRTQRHDPSVPEHGGRRLTDRPVQQRSVRPRPRIRVEDLGTRERPVVGVDPAEHDGAAVRHDHGGERSSRLVETRRLGPAIGRRIVALGSLAPRSGRSGQARDVITDGQHRPVPEDHSVESGPGAKHRRGALDSHRWRTRRRRSRRGRRRWRSGRRHRSSDARRWARRCRRTAG